MNSDDRQTWSPRMRSGWAFPRLNFAGKGVRYNLGARPRSDWDFVAKIHDLNYYANGLKFNLLPPSRGKRRSKLERTDYIFREMSKEVERTTNEELLNVMSKFVFCGRDRDEFIANDGFINIIEDKEVSVANSYFMIPWSEISKREQENIESWAYVQAREIFKKYSLKDLRAIYKINTSKRVKAGFQRKRRRESTTSRNKRVIQYIAEEIKYNVKTTIDEEEWRDWAHKKFQNVWAEMLTI